MPETKTDPLALAAERARRLAMIADGYEVGDEGMPDGSVPGAARPELTAQRYPCDVEAGKLIKHPRYVLVTQYGNHGNYRLYLANDLANVEQLAAGALTSDSGSELVICYFDLDDLAGEEPTPCEGDRVRLTEKGVSYGSVQVDKRSTDVVFYVVGAETDTFDGRAFEWLYLSTSVDADYLSGDYDAKVDEQHVEVIERVEPDERMPVRYGLAKIVVSVTFNTVPSP
jgi:hypothetical protein